MHYTVKKFGTLTSINNRKLYNYEILQKFFEQLELNLHICGNLYLEQNYPL